MPSWVSGTGADGVGTPSFTVSYSADDLILVYVVEGSGGHDGTCTVNGNSATQIDSTSAYAAPVDLYGWWATASGSSVTVAVGGSFTYAVSIGIVSGGDTSVAIGSLDYTVNGATSAGPATATLAGATDSLFISFAGSTSTLTAQSPGTLGHNNPGSGVGIITTVGYWPGATSQTANWTLGGTDFWVTYLVEVPAAGGGGGLSIPVAMRTYRNRRA